MWLRLRPPDGVAASRLRSARSGGSLARLVRLSRSPSRRAVRLVWRPAHGADASRLRSPDEAVQSEGMPAAEELLDRLDELNAQRANQAKPSERLLLLERDLGEARDWLEAAEGEKAGLLKKLEEEQAGRAELEGQVEASAGRQAELEGQLEAAKKAGAGAAELSGRVEELERELGEARDWLEAAEGEKAGLLKKLEE